MTMQLSRRDFLKSAATGAVVLVVGVNASGVLAAGRAETVVNPFVRIDENGFVTVIVKHFEMGQGTTTGLTTLVAEELDADWRTVKIEFAPADREKYKNLFWGMQGTGGSSAIANSFMQYRTAGSVARDLMVRAAALEWGVDASDIVVSNGILTAGSKRGHFGDFVEQAMRLTPPESPQLKSPQQFKLIGKVDLPRKDSQPKTDGSAIFAIDVKRPGMVYATIKRSPRFGGVLQSFDTSAARKIGGFIDAKALPNNTGVVVYGKNTWAAFQARDALEAEWDFARAESRSTVEMIANHRELANNPEFDAGHVARADAEAALDGAARMVEAEFLLPFLAHAPMEPLNCVIEPTENGVRFHDGCQGPGFVQGAVGRVLGLQPEQIEINTVYAGGSFGRRGTPTADYQVEAALAFALLGKKTPVKLIWSREDDIRGGYYRAMALHRAKIGLDDSGKIVGQRVHVDKLHMTVDCGVAVNPDVIRAQMEGGAGYALGAVLRNEITFDNGKVEQSNFPDYQPLRLTDMPQIDVAIVPSADAPSGVGEPGTPPTVANAIFAKTGQRILQLPMTKAGFEFV